MIQNCFFCGHTVSLVHVHGHYQCPVCNTNALPCCDGDNCDTNLLLDEQMSDLLPEQAPAAETKKISAPRR